MKNLAESFTGRTPLILASFLFLLLVFWLATPFDFSWPGTVWLMEDQFSVAEAIARMRHGNLMRRIALLMLAAFSLFSLAWTKNRYRLNSITALLMILYLGLILLSLAWSVDVVFTLRRVVIVCILWFAATVAAARFSLRELALLAVLVTGTTLLLAVGNELRLQTMDPADELWRFAGLFHTVTMGWNCGLLAISALFLLHGEERVGRRFLLAVVIIFALVFLLLTKSRMAVVATLVGMGYFRFRLSSPGDRILVILGVIIITCLAYLSLGDRLLSLGEEASTLGRGEAARESVGSLTGRTLLWAECFRWAAQRPLRGYGFNTFISPEHVDTIARNVGWLPNSTHSGYLDALLGIGYPGAVVLILFLLSAFIRSLLLSRNVAEHGAEYDFAGAVLLWLAFNLFLEANLITRPLFMTFFSMCVLARLALLPAGEWER